MKCKLQPRWKRQSGGVLITALVFAAIVTLFVGGVTAVSVSHLSRNSVEADYATAIQLADAGVNFELRWLYENNATAGDSAHQIKPGTGQHGVYTGTVDGMPGGSFTVGVIDQNGGSWRPPEELIIRSTGTINGISRTIEITGQRRGLFADYAIFFIEEGKLAGTSSTVIGSVGTNGPVFLSGGFVEANIQGNLTYHSFPSVSPLTSPPPANIGYNPGAYTYWNPDPVPWPTVEQIAAELFPGGLSYLRSNNSNHLVRKFSTSDPNYTIENSVVAPMPVGLLSNAEMNTYVEDGNPNDVPPDGRYHDGLNGLYRRKVAILPPGDYLFNRINLTNPNNYGLLIDNAAGMVRIWIDGDANSGDSLDAIVAFTSPDKNKFRLYYNKCNALSLGGNVRLNGSVYAYNTACGTKLPEVKLHGGSRLNGSLITKYGSIDGGSVVNFPNNGGGIADDDFALWYGFRNTYREINPNGGPVFPDGTSK